MAEDSDQFSRVVTGLVRRMAPTRPALRERLAVISGEDELLLGAIAGRNAEAVAGWVATHDPARLGAMAGAAGLSACFGQEGEDLIIARLLGDREPGAFADIGAHHPIRYSNTFALYCRGWRGVNADATPGSAEAFRRLRPRDVTVEAAVSDRGGFLKIHLFETPALNTADPDLASRYVAEGWKKIGEAEVPAVGLAELLDRHLPSGRSFDLLSVDVEGGEMGVLRSNDWDRFRPELLAIEVLDVPLSEVGSAEPIAFLGERGYEPVSKLVQSVILRREDLG